MDEVHYLITDEQYNEIDKHLDRAVSAKVAYNKDKLVMAETALEVMRTQIKLAKNALKRIKGDCCGG